MITQEDIDGFTVTERINMYQIAATKSAIYPGRGTLLGFSYCAHKLAGEAGELNEHFGKAQRDDALFTNLSRRHEHFDDDQKSDGWSYTLIIRELTPERRAFLIKEIGDCLWYLSALCNELGITLFDAAIANLIKLKSRTDRNVLSGSGDNR